MNNTLTRLQSIEPISIVRFEEGIPTVVDVVTGEQIMNELVIRDSVLAEQVMYIAAKIAHWGRLSAQAKRVWDYYERIYRVWRDTYYLAIITSSDKKPTKNEIDGQIRSDPKYTTHYMWIEEAEENYNACEAVLSAFRAQKAILVSRVVTRSEDGVTSLSI